MMRGVPLRSALGCPVLTLMEEGTLRMRLGGNDSICTFVMNGCTCRQAVPYSFLFQLFK